MAASAVIQFPVSEQVLGEARVRSRRTRLFLLIASVLVLALGAMEDVYGNTDRGDVYGSDAVQYLDIARAIQRHDWHSALNPLWSQGYPALLAAARPLFAAGPVGDWADTRTVNFIIFAADYLAFLYLLFGLIPTTNDDTLDSPRSRLLLVTGLVLFVTTQLCLGVASRVNPDQLVNTFFFLTCGLLIRFLYTKPTTRPIRFGLLLGLVLGLAFITKAVFLLLGCGILALLALALWQQRRPLSTTLAAAAVFGLIAGSYGTALSRAVGHRTFGEAGSINYAWHVDRLQKWVHWEGGNQTASEAWPKPWIAGLAQWDTHPPDFGKPIHPSQILQQSPLVYGFAAPFHATYTPYFNPPYWYEGYRHIVRPRYQAIALVKSVIDLLQSLRAQPIFFCLMFALAIPLWPASHWALTRRWLQDHWVLPALALYSIAIYLPVHLEGRYLAAFLALLGITALTACSHTLSSARLRVVVGLILLGLAGDLLRYQVPVLRNILHHKSPARNVEWLMGTAVLDQHLPPDATVGVIAWTPNLQSDWAYIGHVQITSEIGSGPDFNLFWNSPADQQLRTLDTFRRAGAVAVFAKDKPPALGTSGWQQLNGTPLWMYRLQPNQIQ